MTQKNKTIGFRSDEEYHRKVRREAMSRGTTMQALVEKAVADYLALAPRKNTSTASMGNKGMIALAVSEEEAPWIELLLGVLRGNRRGSADTIKQNLVIFGIFNEGDRNAVATPTRRTVPDFEGIDTAARESLRSAREFVNSHENARRSDKTPGSRASGSRA